MPGAPLKVLEAAVEPGEGAPPARQNVPGHGLSARTRRSSVAASIDQFNRPSSRVSFGA